MVTTICYTLRRDDWQFAAGSSTGVIGIIFGMVLGFCIHQSRTPAATDIPYRENVQGASGYDQSTSTPGATSLRYGLRSLTKGVDPGVAYHVSIAS